MSLFEKKVEEFAQKLIEHHGFRFNDGFSCLVPDKDTFPSNEGLFVWGFSQKRMRFETKIEKFHTSTRINRMEEMLDVSEKDYKKLFSSIENYLKALKAIGFKDIGKGVVLFEKTKLYNVQADALYFEKNLDALKEFELLTLNNQIVKFAEGHNYFKVKNRDKLVWDKEFGRTSSAGSAKAGAKVKAAAKPKVAKSSAGGAKPNTTKVSSAKATIVKKVSSAKAIPAKKVSSAKAVPAKKASSAKVVPAKKASSAKVVPAKKASSAKVVPAKKASSVKAVPAKKASNAKAAPVKKASTTKVAVAKASTANKAKPSDNTGRKVPSHPSRVPATPSLTEKLEKLATSQPESSLDGEEKKGTWTKQVNSLYKKVQNWLSDHQKNGHITFNVNKTKLSEENLGAYEVKSLELDLVGGHQVILQPIEMNILGSVGRVDVFHRGYNPHKVMLLLHGDSKEKLHWELWKGFRKEEQQPFTKENLEALLNQWIES